MSKKNERFTGLFLLQFLIAWLNRSCTCFMLLVTGTDQKQKKVSCSQRAVVTSDGAVVLTCLSVPLLLLSRPETQDSQCSGAFSQKRQHPSWWHCHMDSQVTSMEMEEIPPLQACTSVNNVTVPTREKARVALSHQHTAPDQTALFQEKDTDDLQVQQKWCCTLSLTLMDAWIALYSFECMAMESLNPGKPMTLQCISKTVIADSACSAIAGNS